MEKVIECFLDGGEDTLRFTLCAGNAKETGSTTSRRFRLGTRSTGIEDTVERVHHSRLQKIFVRSFIYICVSHFLQVNVL